jgi:hypothetical protein
MGNNPTLVTRGLAETIAVVVVAAVVAAARKVGRSGREFIPEIVYAVRAALLEVNKVELTKPIPGVSRRTVKPNEEHEISAQAEIVSSTVSRKLQEILIRAKAVGTKKGRR